MSHDTNSIVTRSIFIHTPSFLLTNYLIYSAFKSKTPRNNICSNRSAWRHWQLDKQLIFEYFVEAHGNAFEKVLCI
jgi:hypothetical protein